MKEDSILIEGLRVAAIVGVLPHEREHAQTLQLDLALSIDADPAAASEALDKTIDYAELSQGLAQFIQEQRFQLLETLAVKSCERLLSDYSMLHAATLTVRKLHKVANCDSVGVRVHRVRP